MKTDLTTPGSFAQSKALNSVKQDSAVKKGAAQVLEGKDKLGSGPDYKLDLSGVKPTSLPSMPSMPSMPSAPSVPEAKVEPEKDLVKDLEEKLTKEAAKEKIKEELPEIKKTEKMDEVKMKDGTLKRPAIIFIKGWDVFSSPSKSEGGYAGMARIADSVDGSKVYGWSQKSDIIKEVKKVEANQPVILVGHSFGGDTAVEVANELDSLEHGFRGVDLLVTIDAVGFNNDIIPQNVRKHLNVFGETSSFLNDGPHVARKHEKTDVTNILSPLDHTDIDDDKSVQYEIVNLIQKSLTGFV